MADYEVKVKGKKREPEMPKWAEPVLRQAEWLDTKIGVRFWSITGLVIASFVFGTPHVLNNYECMGRCGPNATEVGCQYIGLSGSHYRQPVDGRCPRLRLL